MLKNLSSFNKHKNQNLTNLSFIKAYTLTSDKQRNYIKFD